MKNLTLSQRIELFEALCESISQEGDPPLTAEQADELDRRLIAHQQEPDDVVPWEIIKNELDFSG